MVKHLLYLITPRRKPAALPIAGGDEDPEANVEDKNDDMLKKLTNVTKYKLNTECLTETGRRKLKKVKEERDAELALFERKVRLLWLSVDYFQKKREKECLELKERCTLSGIDRSEYCNWEIAMKEAGSTRFRLNIFSQRLVIYNYKTCI